MSAFNTFTPMVQGVPGGAPRVFSACTDDDLGTITATGYLNDLGAKHVKQNDVWYINYDEDSANSLGIFTVDVSGDDYSLVATEFSGTLGTAAAKAASDNTKATLASLNATPVVSGNIASFSATNGTIADSGVAVGNVKSAASTTYAGGGTSNAFTVTGVTTSSIVVASIKASANAVSIAKVVPTADTVTVTFSADPGAGTVLSFVYTLVAQ